MNAKNIRDIAEYVVLECKNNLGIPEYAQDAMRAFWQRDFIDDVVLGFGAYSGHGLWDVPKDYQNWIAGQVEHTLKTSKVSGVSFKS